MPSPKILGEVFADIRPHLIVAVPLIIEKIIKKSSTPATGKVSYQADAKNAHHRGKIRHKIKRQILDAFGGRFKLLAVGGAALNKEVEAFLHSVKFPLHRGLRHDRVWACHRFRPLADVPSTSCGRAVDRMEIRIDSPDPFKQVGEILTKGMNVMDGYYNNPEASIPCFPPTDGSTRGISACWIRTGISTSRS